MSPRISGRGSTFRSAISTSQAPNLRFFAGNHRHPIIGPPAIHLANGGLQVVEIPFHEAEWQSHLAGAFSPFERAPFAIHAVRVAVSPLLEGLTEGLGRHDMFPL